MVIAAKLERWNTWYSTHKPSKGSESLWYLLRWSTATGWRCSEHNGWTRLGSNASSDKDDKYFTLGLRDPFSDWLILAIHTVHAGTLPQESEHTQSTLELSLRSLNNHARVTQLPLSVLRPHFLSHFVCKRYMFWYLLVMYCIVLWLCVRAMFTMCTLCIKCEINSLSLIIVHNHRQSHYSGLSITPFSCARCHRIKG